MLQGGETLCERRLGRLPSQSLHDLCSVVDVCGETLSEADVREQEQVLVLAADAANLAECFQPYAEWVNSIRAVRTEAALRGQPWTQATVSHAIGTASSVVIAPATTA